MVFDMFSCCVVRSHVEDAIQEVSLQQKQARLGIEAAVGRTKGASQLNEICRKPVQSPRKTNALQPQAHVSTDESPALRFATLVAVSAALVVGGFRSEVGVVALTLLCFPLGAAFISSVQGGRLGEAGAGHDAGTIAQRKHEQARCEDEGVAAVMRHFAAQAVSRPDVGMDEATCRRFLVARKGDVPAAIEMLQRYADWRLEAKPEQVTAADCPNELAKRKGFVHGFDSDGQSILWVFAGRHRKDDRDANEIRNLLLYTIESAIAKSEAEGQQRVCVVFNLAGFGFKTMDYEVVKDLIFILGNFYPERLGRVLLWNAPSIFNMFWRAVKPWIDPNTVKRIGFVGGSLKEFIAPDQLPADVTQPM